VKENWNNVGSHIETFVKVPAKQPKLIQTSPVPKPSLHLSMASSSVAQKLVGLKKFVVVKIKTKKETRDVAMTPNNEGTLPITPLEILDES
jgi:hypothetical protein